MSFPAPLIKSFHYSGHDRARTATRESSDFSFISVPVKCPETSSQLLDHRRKKSPKNYKKPKIKGGVRVGVSVLRSEPHLLDRFSRKKNLLDLV